MIGHQCNLCYKTAGVFQHETKGGWARIKCVTPKRWYHDVPMVPSFGRENCLLYMYTCTHRVQIIAVGWSHKPPSPTFMGQLTFFEGHAVRLFTHVHFCHIFLNTIKLLCILIYTKSNVQSLCFFLPHWYCSRKRKVRNTCIMYTVAYGRSLYCDSLIPRLSCPIAKNSLVTWVNICGSVTFITWIM